MAAFFPCVAMFSFLLSPKQLFFTSSISMFWIFTDQHCMLMGKQGSSGRKCSFLVYHMQTWYTSICPCHPVILTYLQSVPSSLCHSTIYLLITLSSTLGLHFIYLYALTTSSYCLVNIHRKNKRKRKETKPYKRMNNPCSLKAFLNLSSPFHPRQSLVSPDYSEISTFYCF